jgi:hypothetical protein
MAVKPFNSIEGFSVGGDGNIVVYANLDIVGNTITADGNLVGNGLVVNGISNLNDIGNVKIAGGTSGQAITTDGLGNLSFGNITVDTSPAPMPIVIDSGNTLTIPANYQGLFGYPLTVDGDLVVDGILIDVNDNSNGGGGGGSPGGSNTQVQYNDAGTFGGNSTFTFDDSTGILAAPNVVVTGNITPSANVTYSLGNNTHRFNDLYLSGSTITLGGATLSANSTSLVITNPQGGQFVVAGTTDTGTSSLANGNSNIRIAANSSIGFTANGTSNVFLVTKDGVSVTGNAGFTGNITTLADITALGELSAANITTGGSISATGDLSAGNLSITGSFEASGNLSGVNINTSGDLSVVGNANIASNAQVTGNAVVGLRLTVGSPIGAYKSDLYSNGYASLANLGVSGNISANNVTLSSNLSVAGTANIGTLLASGVNTLGNVNAANISATGNIIGANANLGNLVVANFFQGDGHLLSNITVEGGTSITNGNSNVSVAPNANVTFSVNGSSNVITVTDTDTYFDTNIIANQSIEASVIANGVTKMTIDGTGTWVAFNITGAANVLEVHDNFITVTGNSNLVGNTNVTGNINVSSGTIKSTGDILGQTLTANGIISTSGNINASNINAGNFVTANFLQGDGYLISNLTISAGSAITNGTSNVQVAPSANVTITAEGNANVVTVTGNGVIFDKQISGGLATFTTANVTGLNATSLFVQNELSVNSNITANGGAFYGNGLTINSGPGYAGSGSFEGNLSVGGQLFVTGYSNLGQLNVSSVTVHNNLGANGTISANYISASYNVTASNMSASGNLSVSGNTTLHATTVTGNITAGNINGGNLVTANYISGDGYLLSNLTVPAGTYLLNGTSNIYVDGSGNVRTSVDGTANVVVVTSTGANVSGTISASGNANVGNLGTAGRITATGNLNAGNIITAGIVSATGNGTFGNISATGNIVSANANLGNLVRANFFQGDGYLLSNLTVSAGSSITNGSSNVLVTTDSNVNITVNGTANVVQVTEGNVIVTGDLVATGVVEAASFANGSSNIAIADNGPINISINGVDGVVGITSSGVYSNVKLYALEGFSVAGNSNIGNLGLSGFITTPGNIAGGNVTISSDLTVSGQSNLAGLRTTGAITAIGNLSAGNIFTAGLSNVQTLYVGTGGANINGDTTITGNIGVTGNFTVTGNLNYQNVTDLVVGDPLIYIGEDNTSDLVDLGLVVSYDDGTYQHGGMARNHTDGVWKFFSNVIAEPTTVIDWANAVMAPVQTGNLTASNITATGNVNANYFNGNVVGNITGNVVISSSNTQVLFSDSGTVAGNTGFTFNKTTGAFVVPGNITGANLVTAGVVSATGNGTFGNVTATLYVGNLSGTGNSNVGNLGGTGIFATTLSATSNANIGNIGTAGLITATGNITGGNLVTSGLLTVTGNANIGNIGTAGLLTATGNITGGNLVTSGLLTVTGNATAGNIITAGIVSATGNGTFGNVTATLYVGNVSGTGNSNVGNLGVTGIFATTVSATGNANIGNIGTAGLITATGNITGGNVITTGLVTATGNLTAGNLVTGGLVSATGNGTFGNVSIVANVTTANLSVTGVSNLGAPANITITGGTSGYVLQTDGAGNLSWTAQSGGGGGSANIPIYDEGNLLTSAVGSMNFVGSGVTATNVGNAVTITIPGASSGLAAVTVDTFTGTGLQTAFTLSVAPDNINYTSVNIDGVDQLKSAYSVTGTTLTMVTAPSLGAHMDVTIISAVSSAQPSFTTRNYTGDGSTTTYTVTNGVTATGVLVMLNGIVQTPTTDYTVSGTTLTFGTAPSLGQAIQIRELGTVVANSSSGGASDARALGYSLVFGL